MDAVIVVIAKYFFLISVAVTAVIWVRQSWNGKWTLAVAGLVGGLIGLGLVALAGALYFDPRPFVVQHIHPLFAHAADNGFPSDHAALTMFLAVCVWFYSRRWSLVLAANAVLVGIARVLAHVHSPLDIVVGYIIGAVAAVVASLAAPAIVRLIPAVAGKARDESSGQP